MIARPLARRIDRLARAAHAFHRFAHHPLCGAYEGEVVRLGLRARVCRGCASALLGLGAGFAAGVALSPPPWVALLAALAFAGLAANSSAHRTAVRAPKWRTRFLPSASLALALGGFARAPSLASAGAAALSLAMLVGLLVAYRRRGPDRSACATCPELRAPAPCRGFAAIARRERAFRRLAGRWIDRSA